MKYHLFLVAVLIAGILMPSIILSGQSPIPYQIQVTSREVLNRIVESQVRHHRVLADQPKAFGADDLAPTPPEYLALAYSTCLVSTLRFMAMLNKQDIRDIEVQVAGEVDFSRAMGLATPNRAGFSGLNVRIRFESAMTHDQKLAFVEQAMARGAVLDNVSLKTPVSYEVVK